MAPSHTLDLDSLVDRRNEFLKERRRKKGKKAFVWQDNEQRKPEQYHSINNQTSKPTRRSGFGGGAGRGAF